MELHDAIYQRRSVRRFSAREVPDPLIYELIDAAIQAPSAVNQQPWAFGVIRGADRLHEFSERAKIYMLSILPQTLSLHRRSDELTDENYNVFHGANTLIVIYARQAPHQPAEDCCLAAQNLMLTAHSLGLGSCPVGFARPWLDLFEIKNELQVPLRYHTVMPIVVGWPQGNPPAAPARREPEIVTWLAAPTPAAAAASTTA